MRILRVTSDLYPHVMGGVGVHTHEMSKSQSAKGHDVTVLSSSSLSDEKNGAPYDKVDFTTALELFGNKISLDLFFKILDLMDSHDIVHAHSHLFHSTNVAALLRRMGGKPLVITSHGLYSQTASQAIQSVYMPVVGRWTLRSADRVICYTSVEKEQIVDLGIPEGKIVVINNGVDTTVFKPPSDKGRDKTILWVGRYVHGKGVDILIEGFSKFSKLNPEYRLLMVGKGPLKGGIERLVESHSLRDKVEFIDSMPNELMPEIYSSSEIFILTSYEEGVPRSILEAMACGVPIVCSALPQLQEIVQDAGVLVPSGDPIAVARALSELADDERLRNQFGHNARSRAESEFSWSNTVDKTLKLYKQVIGESNK